ncbi:hypothetical protein GLYMA_13G061800v4 [Glycine max]|nr:uncharacterized protein LOC114381634 [Glycine soja]KAH1100073.1 hypothetical protein GYH30_035304 [Glycine max]KAH1100074.1 hypothetical protein GYH30_035304 [Glycine max]KAH1215706.1 hypothetical protein GmHk_13G036787 [Glycine max]KRH18460.2 hypothetical protein GLYMA_13G061800v4 [Glycine max]RZB71119.1 hypothetical protein D0Y65_035873 [Glycine soja]|eukprot:XP_006595245.1 uncharacterized protein LOC102667583 isoform X1 [Glycine max]
MSNEKSMANILLNPWQPFLSSTSFKPPKKDKMSDHGRAKAASGSRNRLESKNIVNRTSSFNYRSSSAVPLHELPWASFDQYIEDKGRVIRSIFPEKSASQLLNREEWRVKMTPIQVLFLTCQPVAHITAKCISEADDYPPEIPGHITKFFEIQITKCEFPDLNPDYMPPNFSINGKGALYLERQGRHIWMKNLLDITLNITFPPLLSWVPEYVLQNIVQSVLENYAEDINNGFAVGLLADYNSFKRNKARYSV